jgi:hypothetical protein
MTFLYKICFSLVLYHCLVIYELRMSVVLGKENYLFRRQNQEDGIV